MGTIYRRSCPGRLNIQGGWRHFEVMSHHREALRRAPADAGAQAQEAAEATPRPFSMPSAYWSHYGVVQRRASGEQAAADPTRALGRAAGSAGQPLPADLQRRFEGSLGADLSGVRVHTGTSSAEAARSVGARAYTTGSDIHFAHGQYDAASRGGQELLAHEVAHTVQQSRAGGGGAQYKLAVSQPGDAAEREADGAAAAMVAGRPAAVSSSGAAGKLLRQSHNEGAADSRAQGAQQASAAILDDQRFLDFFSHVPQGRHVQDVGQFRSLFAAPPPHTLFTPDEQRAINAFMASPQLPPVGTFATFFGRSDVGESQKLVFAAVLHVLDASLSETLPRVRNGHGELVQQRAVRASDCGTWVARVIAYRNGQSITTRRAFNQQMGSPEAAFREQGGHSQVGNRTRHDETGRTIHTAVTREEMEALQPGDWVMYHVHAFVPQSNPRQHVTPGQWNHSVLFLGWSGSWSGNSRMARVANQADNNVGGGVIFPTRLSCDDSQDGYVYHILSFHSLSSHGGAGHDGQHADATHAAPQ